MEVQPYLFFEGTCEEALNFYKSELGAEITALMRYGDAPDKTNMPQGAENKIMHANFTLGKSQVMASDGMCSGTPGFNGFKLTLSVDTPAEAERLFAILGKGGQVQMPLGPTFFASRFGMLVDRFGVEWMVISQPTT